jgi:hypothetical protein
VFFDPARRALHDRLLRHARHPHLSDPRALDALLEELKPSLVGHHLSKPRPFGAAGLVCAVSGGAKSRLVLEAARGRAGLYLLTRAEADAIAGLAGGEPEGRARHALLLFASTSTASACTACVVLEGERQLLLECGEVTLSLRLWGARR